MDAPETTSLEEQNAALKKALAVARMKLLLFKQFAKSDEPGGLEFYKVLHMIDRALRE